MLHGDKEMLRSPRRKTLTFPATALLCLGILGLVSPHREILTWWDMRCLWHILTSLVTSVLIRSEGFLSLLALLAQARSPWRWFYVWTKETPTRGERVEEADVSNEDKTDYCLGEKKNPKKHKELGVVSGHKFDLEAACQCWPDAVSMLPALRGRLHSHRSKGTCGTLCGKKVNHPDCKSPFSIRQDGVGRFQECWALAALLISGCAAIQRQ